MTKKSSRIKLARIAWAALDAELRKWPEDQRVALVNMIGFFGHLDQAACCLQTGDQTRAVALELP